MARIRTIKPDLTLDYELSSLGFAARYFFINLWCHCDREGRVEDEPKKLHALILPWDKNVDADVLLDELSPKFLVRYEVGGRKFIQIRQFAKHQRPNAKESPSLLPAPLEKQMEFNKSTKKKVLARKRTCLHEKDSGEREGEGNGVREGKGIDLSVPAAPKVCEIVSTEKTAIQRVVEAYKHAKGIPMDDKLWDKANFGRCSKAAKSLLSCFAENVDKCAAYIFLRSQDLNDAGLEWTLETISRHAYDGMGIPKTEEQNGNQSGPMVAVGISGQGRHSWIASPRSTASEALRGIEQAAIHAAGSSDLDVPWTNSGADQDDFS